MTDRSSDPGLHRASSSELQPFLLPQNFSAIAKTLRLGFAVSAFDISDRCRRSYLAILAWGLSSLPAVTAGSTLPPLLFAGAVSAGMQMKSNKK